VPVSDLAAGAHHSDMKLSSALIVVTAVTVAACASKNPPPTTAGGPMPPPTVQTADQGPQLSNDEIAKQLFEAVNKQRSANGLKPLDMSPELATSAQEHSDRMLSGSFLSTRGGDEPSVITRITSSGVKTLKLGEDVVRIKTRPEHVAEETVSIWMGAAADRKNLLSSGFTKTGIGVTRTADGDYYISEDFAQ
jgi:uncharacterized protein YkwD